ncbi:MAG TPA: alpha/beta hydrolase-fold protein [Chitinophagaceae bacterium]|nr:alpha/beta hydrolase-fold protein [Chitinophagaceae bacterium]
MIYRWSLYFFLILSANVFGQELKTRFTLYAPDLPDTSSVYIAGSVPQLGNWNPSRIKMNPQGKQIWVKEIVLSQPISVEYKYTLGSWDREAANEKGLPLKNFSVTVTDGKVVYDTVSYWKDGAARKINGQVTGTVKYHRAMKGEGIKDRDVVVWLPPGYDSSSQKRYSVLYMQDGQNLFDPITSAFGTDWQIDETADSMIRRKAVEPLIIVGIYNTADRSTEYIPSEKGRIYREFIAGHLKSFIDSAYKTKPGRKDSFIGGSSAGGILAFMMVWEYPDKFSRAICMSPAFRLPGNSKTGWNYVTTVKNDPKRKKVFFYIDNGGLGLEQQLQPGVDEMLKALNSKGYKPGRDYIFIAAPDAGHNEEAWSKRFPQALKLVLSKN